jgi:tetratricopeptide (TPR) repeat protein
MRVTLTLAVLLGTVSASAAPKHNDPQKEARELYKTGLTHHNLGEYDAAIADFKKAYELTHMAGLLFNLGQSHRLKKDYEQALHFYRSYLREMPSAPNRADVETLISKTDAAFKDYQQRQQREADARFAAQQRQQQPLVEPKPEIRIIKVIEQAKPLPPPDPRRRRRFLIAGGVTLGLGVGLLAGGIGAGVHAQSQAEAINNLRATGGVWNQSIYNDGQTSATAAIALYVVGGVVAVAGTAVIVTGALQGRQREMTMSFAPMIAPGGGGMVAKCAF